MKLLLGCAAALVATPGFLLAQPQSPPATETATIGGKTISISYSSPRVKNRAGKLFGKDGVIGQDSTYPVWRAGANRATQLRTDADLEIGGLAVPKGDYSLFVDLSDPNAWQLIINKETGQSGLAYKKEQDLGRVPMTMNKTPALVENLNYTITDLGANQARLTLEWEYVSASATVTIK